MQAWFLSSRSVNILDFFVGDLDSNDDLNLSVVNFSPSGVPALSHTVLDVYGPEFARVYPFEFSSAFHGRAFLLWVDGSSDDIEVLGVAVRVSEPAPLLFISVVLLSLVLRSRMSK